MQLEKLVQLLDDARRAYYDLVSYPIMPDAEYDALVEELTEKAPDHPLLRQVGRTPTRGKKVVLENPMFSLQKAKGSVDLHKWLSRVDVEGFVVSHKMDGCAVDLIYEQYYNEDHRYFLSQACTRGDGSVGEDVTTQVLQGIFNVPKSIEVYDEDAIHIYGEDSIHVYGEVIIRKGPFRATNTRRRIQGLEEFSNPRNLANASLGMEDIDEIRSRHLQFYAYDCTFDMALHKKFLELDSLGFDVVEHKVIPLGGVAAIEDLKQYYSTLEDPEQRDSLPYEIDGLVVKVDDLTTFQSMGHTSHHPRGAVAVKFDDEKAVVTVRDIDWSVSRNGIITPQVVIDPVQLGGAEIRRVTMHNARHILDHRIQVGSVIEICRSNSVIPKFMRVIETPEIDEGFVPGLLVPNCPSCGSVTYYEEPNLSCRNIMCPAQLAMNLEHFLSSLEFKGIGEKICYQLVQDGWVKEIPDLWKMLVGELMESLGWSSEHAVKVHLDLAQLRDGVPLDRLLVAMNVPSLGKTAAKKIAQKFVDINSILRAEKGWFILEFGGVTGPRIHRGLRLALIKLWPKLASVGFTVKEPRQLAVDAQKIVITGRLSKPRKEYQEAIESNGHIYQKSLAKDTDYLVCGKDVGSTKITKATKYGTQIVDETWLQGFLQSS